METRTTPVKTKRQGCHEEFSVRTDSETGPRGVSSSYGTGPGDFGAVTVLSDKRGGDGEGDMEIDVSYPVDSEGVGELAAEEKSAL
jgi:hypothetical protein